MSGPRSHRSPKTRFFFYGFALCFVATTFYVYKLKQDHFEFLRRCRAEQSTLSAQLRAVIDYRERMQHSLNAARSQHADAITALHTQQEEQSKLTKNHALVQSLYNNLTLEFTKLKNTIQNEKDIMETYKNQHEETVSNYRQLKKDFDDKTFNTNLKIESLQNENMKLKRDIQLFTEVKQNAYHGSDSDTSPRPINDINKNLNKQFNVSSNVYHVQIFKDEKNDAVENSLYGLGAKSLSSIVTLNSSLPETHNGKSSESLKPEIPLGVLPELPVYENSNDKLPNNKLSNEKADEKPAAHPPNRYKIKLGQEDNNQLTGGENENLPNAQSFLHPDVNLESKKNINIDQFNNVESKFEPEDKEGDIDNDANNNNNREVGAHNDNREDDDDEYQYPAREAGEK